VSDIRIFYLFLPSVSNFDVLLMFAYHD